MNKKLLNTSIRTICFVLSLIGAITAQTTDISKKDLIFPSLLKKEETEAGNPLAAYSAMIELDSEYRNSKMLAGLYLEARFNFEEFLGLPLSGLQAMEMPIYRQSGFNKAESVMPSSFKPQKALDVIDREAQKTQIVIWGEEHHLPQTRSLYEQMLLKLWNRGYRYLAAETFAEKVMSSDFKYPDYKSGYYIKDPIFASALRLAVKLGYKLISYDTSERGAADDSSFRDRKQATNIKERIFDRDPRAKVLILAGRGHASEQVAPGGWTPMANVLKNLTGINPFTIFAPTMTQRLNKTDEHPFYRFAVSQNLVTRPAIFVNKLNNEILGSGDCDAYIFFPEVKVVEGRPDWMLTGLGRKKVKIPKQLLGEKGLILIQAFEQNEPDSAIPVDQILIKDSEEKILLLPKGIYRLRTIDKTSRVLNQINSFKVN